MTVEVYNSQLLPTYRVAAETISSAQYQYLKLADATAGETAATGVQANPLVTTCPELIADVPRTASVTTTSALVLAANTSRRGLIITNLSSDRVALAFGTDAIATSGLSIFASDRWEMDLLSYNQHAVYAITASGTSTIAIQQFLVSSSEPTDALLAEDGDALLAEDGDYLIEEASVPVVSDGLLLESGDGLLAENGDTFTLE